MRATPIPMLSQDAAHLLLALLQSHLSPLLPGDVHPDSQYTRNLPILAMFDSDSSYLLPPIGAVGMAHTGFILVFLEVLRKHGFDTLNHMSPVVRVHSFHPLVSIPGAGLLLVANAWCSRRVRHTIDH